MCTNHYREIVTLLQEGIDLMLSAISPLKFTLSHHH